MTSLLVSSHQWLHVCAPLPSLSNRDQRGKIKTQEAEADSSFAVSVQDFDKTQFCGGEKCVKKRWFCGSKFFVVPGWKNIEIYM